MSASVHGVNEDCEKEKKDIHKSEGGTGERGVGQEKFEGREKGEKRDIHIFSQDEKTRTQPSPHKRFWLDVSLLKTHKDFRRVFVARLVSVMTLGLLIVAVPLQVYQLTQDSRLVGMITALEGGSMFVGMLVGGVLADRHPLRRLILLGRSGAAIGFAGLTLNSLVPSPSLWAIAVFSVWGGFVASISVSALMAALPRLVGRENIPAAGALSMLTVRIGTAIAPLFAAVFLAQGQTFWCYAIATFGTLLTVMLLRGLPALDDAHNSHNQAKPKKHPWQDMLAGLRFMLTEPVLKPTLVLALLDALGRGVRVSFPALVLTLYAAPDAYIAVLFACIPTGAMLGALTSGWLKRLSQTPQKAMHVQLGFMLLGALCLLGLGLSPFFMLSACLLVFYGYSAAISGLIQYTLIQQHTPNALLGRVNAVWSAQTLAGDALGGLLVGMLVSVLPFTVGVSVFAVGVVLGVMVVAVRYRRNNLVSKI